MNSGIVQDSWLNPLIAFTGLLFIVVHQFAYYVYYQVDPSNWNPDPTPSGSERATGLDATLGRLFGLGSFSDAALGPIS